MQSSSRFAGNGETPHYTYPLVQLHLSTSITISIYSIMVIDTVMVLEIVPMTVMATETDLDSMPRERDDESGMYRTAYTDEDFITAIADLDRATTTKIIDRLGCSQRTALGRLHDLEDEGEVEVEKVGNTYVWSVSSGRPRPRA